MFIKENQTTYKLMRFRTASDFSSAKLTGDSGGLQNLEGNAF